MDLWHDFGGDFVLAPTGDLALVGAAQLTQQRVLRRLLTNGGDYIWQPSYGAGLAQAVGQPANALSLNALIRSQIFAEPAVAATPEPAVSVSVAPDSVVAVQLSYTDATTGQTQLLGFSLES